MDQEAIAKAPRSPRLSIRRLLGLHEHRFGPWVSEWATARPDGRMATVQHRECAHCRRVEYRCDVADLPPGGLPYELHLKPHRAPKD